MSSQGSGTMLPPGRERDEKALVLRLSNWSYPAIVTRLGYSSVDEVMNAVRLISQEQLRVETPEENRNLDAYRLDELIRGLWNRGRAGDLDVIDRLIKLLDRRAKLLGLDMPTKAAITSADGKTDLVEVFSEREREARTRALLGMEQSHLTEQLRPTEPLAEGGEGQDGS